MQEHVFLDAVSVEKRYELIYQHKVILLGLRTKLFRLLCRECDRQIVVLNLEFVEKLVAKLTKHPYDLADNWNKLLLLQQQRLLLLECLLVERPDIDLVFPVRVSLAHIILNAQLRDLLVDQSHLHAVVIQVGRWWASSIFNVKSSSSAHGHATIRDADIFKHLESIPMRLRLPLHQFYVRDDVLNNR